MSFSAKVGKVVILNGTDAEWTITLRPNIVGRVAKEEKEIMVCNNESS